MKDVDCAGGPRAAGPRVRLTVVTGHIDPADDIAVRGLGVGGRGVDPVGLDVLAGAAEEGDGRGGKKCHEMGRDAHAVRQSNAGATREYAKSQAAAPNLRHL